MEAFNRTLFLWLNAPAQPDAFVLSLALLAARWLAWLLPLLVVLAWLRGDAVLRRSLLVALAAMALGLLANLAIRWLWPHPRPFMIGLGHQWMPHDASASFPSDHLTLWWAFAFGLALQTRTRGLGLALALLGLPIAWGRIYVGVHFPLDMLGSAGVALLCAGVARRAARWYLAPAYRLALAGYGRLFGRLIARGRLRR